MWGGGWVGGSAGTGQGPKQPPPPPRKGSLGNTAPGLPPSARVLTCRDPPGLRRMELPKPRAKCLDIQRTTDV